jgi:hypothetical protein
MNAKDFNTTKAKVLCRPIRDSDIQDLVALFDRCFKGAQTREVWQRILQWLEHRPTIDDHLPKYGYLLESEKGIVGAILMIFSRTQAKFSSHVKCSVSSWCVDPFFRAYAPFLALHALKHKEVTYLNTSASPHTRSIAIAQGYNCYSNGVFIAVPSLSLCHPREKVRILNAQTDANTSQERDLLLDHAKFGCTSLWCTTATAAHAFVFRARRIRGMAGFAQLIYCSDVSQFVAFGRPLGRYLAMRGQPFVIIDSNRPIPRLIGKYFDGSMPKYFRGPDRPRLGDLAYTETAVFGL